MTTVAVVGVNGFLGKPIIKSLLSEPFISKIKSPIRLVTSSDKKPVESDKVQYINYKESSFTEALKGADVVINLGNVPFSPLQEVLDAVIANKVKLYIPSQFGVYLEDAQKTLPNFLDIKSQHSDAARKAGIKTVDVSTSLFFDNEAGFVGGHFPALQLEKETNSLQIIGNDSVKVNPSYYQDIGNAVAALVTYEDFSKIPDQVRIYSDEVTIADVVAKYERENGVTLNKSYVDANAFVKEVKETYAASGFNPADFLKYLATIYVSGEGKGMIFETTNEREFVNPGESLFKWTRFPKA